MAITMAVCVLIGVLLGLFLDTRLGTDPWLVIIFSLLGCLSGFKSMIDVAKKF
jgi:F0F1-type ATP synthase assembly protein I